MTRALTPTGSRTNSRTSLFRCAPAAAILALLTTLGCTTTTSDASLIEISRNDVAQWLTRKREGTLLIDVRPPDAFQTGTIPGAVNRELSDIRMTANPDDFETYDRVIVFGDNPASNRARAIAKRLLRIGVDDVYFFAGGYEAWTRETP